MSRTIVVAGALANKPNNGGAAWVRMSWIRGLQPLGFDVHFVEVISPDAWKADPDGAPLARNIAYFTNVVASMGLADRATLLTTTGETLAGASASELERLIARATLLINISGHLNDEAWLERFRRRAYVDLDPAYTQYWHADGLLGETLAKHHVWFTVGLNVGSRGCPIPTGGFPWRPVLPPVVMDDWPVRPSVSDHKFTTIGAWRGAFGPLVIDGQPIGQKAHEWRKFMGLPRALRMPVEAALKIDSGDESDRQRLENHGWRLVDPESVAGTPVAFRRYVAGSFAELSLAQGAYVETNSGWFSDRTVRYLASGKPALIQDTGASSVLPTGEGLLTFRDADEAAAGAQAIASDYVRHSRAARRLAEHYFNSDRVLTEFLTQAGVT